MTGYATVLDAHDNNVRLISFDLNNPDRFAVLGRYPAVDALAPVAGLAAVELDGRSRSGCRAVVSLPDRKKLWSACTFAPQFFSPSGTWLLTSTSRLIGNPGERDIQIVDARSGKLRDTFAVKPKAKDWRLGYAVFESDTSVLLDVVQGKDEALVRCQVPSGSCGLATTPVRAILAPSAILFRYRLPMAVGASY